MIAIVKTRPQEGLEILDINIPKPKADEILIKVKSTGICGSDVHIYEWSSGYEWISEYLPLIPGHEISGIVISKGEKVKTFYEGDKVTCMPTENCGDCELCKQGIISVCSKGKTIGLSKNGAFTEYISVPEKYCTKLNKEVNLDIAALTEPLAVCACAVEKAGEITGNKIAVIGSGMIGLGICYFTNLKNANVWNFGKDKDKDKFRIAKILGAKDCINVDEKNFIASSKNITNDLGFDVVFDATGVVKVVQDCFKITKRNGKIIAVGIYSENLEINLTSMVRQQKNLITSYGYTNFSWRKAVKIIDNLCNVNILKHFISRKFRLKNGINAFESAKTHSGIKIIINP